MVTFPDIKKLSYHTSRINRAAICDSVDTFRRRNTFGNRTELNIHTHMNNNDENNTNSNSLPQAHSASPPWIHSKRLSCRTVASTEGISVKLTQNLNSELANLPSQQESHPPPTTISTHDPYIHRRYLIV
jgi:hypothetical protein